MSVLCITRALVCAIFLDCACAIGKFGPWAREEFYFGLCHKEHIGYRTRKILTVPEIVIKPFIESYDLSIPDYCEPNGMSLAGVVVTVCDTDSQPDLTLTSVTNGFVRRPGKPLTSATCFIKEYCN